MIRNYREVTAFTAIPLNFHRELQSLNQRVQSSSPCAPTTLFNDLAETVLFVPTRRSAVIPTNLLLSFGLSFSGEIARMVIFTIDSGSGAVLHGVE
jgi:hypothetical protein